MVRTHVVVDSILAMVEIGVNGIVVDRAAPAILFPKLLIAAMVAKMMSSLGQLQFHPHPR